MLQQIGRDELRDAAGDVTVGACDNSTGGLRGTITDLLEAYRRQHEPLRPETVLVLEPEIYVSHGRRFVGCAYMLRSAGAHQAPGSLLASTPWGCSVAR